MTVLDLQKLVDEAAIVPPRIEAGVNAPPRFQLLRAADLLMRGPMEWVCKGVLPAEGIAVIYGAPGSGKSFLVLDLLAAIADGHLWFGYRTKPAPVVYLGLEGEGGLPQRVRAYQTRRPIPDQMRFILGRWDVRQDSDRNQLVQAVMDAGMAGGVLVIDTLNRSAPGSDENSSQDMGNVIAGLREIQRLLGGLVLAVHHSGKDPSRGLRGHSSLLGTIDAALQVKREGGQRSWSLVKSKDGSDGMDHAFDLSIVNLGTDDDGDPITSCFVTEREPKLPLEMPAIAKKPRGPNQKAALRLILEAIELRGVPSPIGSTDSMVKRITFEMAVKAAEPEMPGGTKHRRYRAREAIEGLIKHEFLRFEDDFIFSP